LSQRRPLHFSTLFGFLLYFVIRIALLPADRLTTGGFSHDGAYLTLVARNLMAGKGLVLDSLWLVFLQPDRLPLPYHNANPLFPILNAGFSSLFGTDVVLSSFLLSILGSVFLWASVTWLLRHYFPEHPRLTLAASFLTVLFPEPWTSSWNALTDEVWCALMVGSVAALVRSERKGMAVLAAAFWALAWLTRSMASLAVPAGLVWMVLALGVRKTAVRAALMTVVGLAICSPWLIHTARTWGSPLRSDGDYMFSTHAYYAHKFEPFSAVHVWHTPTPPLKPGEVIRLYPGEVWKAWSSKVWMSFKMILAGACYKSIPALGVLLLLAALVAWRERRSLWSPEAAAFLVYFLTFFAAVSILGPYLEPRYFIFGYTLFAAWLWMHLLRMASSVPGGERSPGVSAPLVLAGGFLVLFLLPQGYHVAQEARYPNPGLERYRQAALRFDHDVVHGAPVVVGFHPYLYTMYTGAPALGIPNADDAYLLRYMEKYGARHVLLSEYERGFWKPAWNAGPPPGLRLVRESNGYFLYERTAGDSDL
jgi:hypothetical protein